ncbi:hypothetical protein D3870_13355 [Noviherbaspirillum cavernae]|uniref:C-type lysozyme inhibitor domain-containing protein n=2 Tax=Noviherbaspirillum cavernae TaxID=2320862 RepID=A0A418X314_9BURK|nr:hypothetical protein D3870_13355 [Noviherbaspirillum cavernae]
MKKLFPVLFGIGMTVAIPHAFAESAAPAPTRKPVKHAAKKAVQKTDEDNQPDLAGKTRTDFHCELGNKVSIYDNAGDNQRIGMRWNKKMHELTRVETSTGAHRFEDKDAGLVWISIPAKSMLLDSKKGLQLANECRSREHMKAKSPNT